ncbi:MAG: Holliday junction resolvase-like protein [Berkelbacteria bacterium GW2011_GWE1_39_12]|uniref:Holliday junction resolvase-like protein n=1 Tax=Berkelbacteria bacterium GW2011_GWE1_39_12 TaxID=1618337 RepID=A0A0G4B4Q4_9BACT|nr:MAG: Holliday junction resolvase-like protein [Berkelbacteria bacterium GW2011_GWE1_39_12]
METKIQVILILLIFNIFFIVLWRTNKNRYNDLAFRKQSLSSRYGKMTEQFMPFLKDYPYDPCNFRFLGSPIDGVQFEEDKVIFIEFKTANSKMSDKQRNIADLIYRKKIDFEEHRID